MYVHSVGGGYVRGQRALSAPLHREFRNMQRSASSADHAQSTLHALTLYIIINTFLDGIHTSTRNTVPTSL